MSTRYFEFVGSDAQRPVAAVLKFWEGTVDWSTLTARFGKIGWKDPLARGVRPAPTAEAVETLAETMIADNIQQGWEPLESET